MSDEHKDFKHLSPETFSYFEAIWRTHPTKFQTEETRRLIESLLSKEEISELYAAFYSAALLSSDKREYRRTVRQFKLWSYFTVTQASDVRRLHRRPPFNAEYLLYLLLRKEEREVVIGDLIEEYVDIERRFGERHANFWFYKQVAGSLWPLLRRTLLKLGALVWLDRVLRRLIS